MKFREKLEIGDPKIKLLLPKVVKKALWDAAKKNKCSSNTEIIKRINTTFSNPEIYKNIENALKPIVLKIYNTQG